MTKLISFSIFVSLIFLVPSQGTAESWLYEDGGASMFAAILCHGKGGDPESYVVDPLRLELNEQLGFHTISLQMPGGVSRLWNMRRIFQRLTNRLTELQIFYGKKG